LGSCSANHATFTAAGLLRNPEHASLWCGVCRLNDLQHKDAQLLDESKVLPITRDNSGSDRATAEGNQDIIEQARGEFTAKLRRLFEPNRNDSADLLPDQMAWRNDTADTLKGFVERRNLASLPGSAGASEEFLHHH